MKCVEKFSKYLLIIPLLAIICSCNEKEQGDPFPDDFVWNLTPDSFTPYTEVISVGPDSLFTGAESFEHEHDLPYMVQSTGLSLKDLGTSILTGCASGLGSFAVNTLLSTAFGEIFESEEVQLLNQVLDKLEVMETKLDELTSLAMQMYNDLKETEQNAIVASYKTIEQHLLNLSFVNTDIYGRLESAIANGYDEEAIKSIISAWETSVINGISAPYAAQSLAAEILNFSYKFNSTPYNFFMVTDMIAFDSYPWEESGYEYREMYRAFVSAELVRAMFLSAACYQMHKSANSLNNLSSYALTLEKFFELCKVVHHDDVAICQIKGAHFTVGRDALVIREGFDWTFGQTHITPQQAIVLEGTPTSIPSKDEVNSYLSSQLTDAEVQAIIGYYKSVHPSEFTLLDCFADGGMKIPAGCIPNYTLKPDTQEVENATPIYFGTADSGIFVYSEDPWDDFIEEGWHFGLGFVYQAGVPVGSYRRTNVFGFMISYLQAWKPVRIVEDYEHPAYSSIAFGLSYHMIDNLYYYDRWFFTKGEPRYNYPDNVLMLRKNSLKRY